jgi:hypothetical protein
MVAASTAGAQDVSWFIDDGPDAGGYRWSDVSMGPLWEHMHAAALEDDACSLADLPYPPPTNEYFACTPLLTVDYGGYAFWAELWLANNYPDHSNPVTVELRRGAPMAPGELLASANVSVTNYLTPAKYTFAFGGFDMLILANQSLVLRIVYTGEAGDAHVYWDSFDCPSALHGELVSVPLELESWGRIKATFERR